MKLFKYMIPLVVALGFTCATAYAGDTGDFSRYDEELNEKDWDVLRDYLNTKRTIDVAEKACNLMVSSCLIARRIKRIAWPENRCSVIPHA